MPTSRSYEIDQVTIAKVLAVTVIIGLLVILQYLTYIIKLENSGSTLNSYYDIVYLLIIGIYLAGGIILVNSIKKLLQDSNNDIINVMGILGSLIYLYTSLAYAPSCPTHVEAGEFPYFSVRFGHSHYITLFGKFLTIESSVFPSFIFNAPSGGCYMIINMTFPLLAYFFIALWLWNNNILPVKVLNLDAE